jgi:hypothetical protein
LGETHLDIVNAVAEPVVIITGGLALGLLEAPAAGVLARRELVRELGMLGPLGRVRGSALGVTSDESEVRVAPVGLGGVGTALAEQVIVRVTVGLVRWLHASRRRGRRRGRRR